MLTAYQIKGVCYPLWEVVVHDSNHNPQLAHSLQSPSQQKETRIVAKTNLDAIFTYHPPFGTQQARYVQLRDAAKTFAQLVIDLTPPSREQSLAITSIQQATQMANAAIAIHEVPVFSPLVVDQIDGRPIPLSAEQADTIGNQVAAATTTQESV